MLSEAELEIAGLADIKRVVGAAKNVQISHALTTTMPFREPLNVPGDELAAAAAWQQTFESFSQRYRGFFAVAVDCHS